MNFFVTIMQIQTNYGWKFTWLIKKKNSKIKLELKINNDEKYIFNLKNTITLLKTNGLLKGIFELVYKIQ